MSVVCGPDADQAAWYVVLCAVCITVDLPPPEPVCCTGRAPIVAELDRSRGQGGAAPRRVRPHPALGMRGSRPPRRRGCARALGSFPPQMRPETMASATKVQLRHGVGLVCKTVGYAFDGSNPSPATPAKTPPDQHVCQSGAFASHAVVCSRERWCAGGCAQSAPKSTDLCPSSTCRRLGGWMASSLRGAHAFAVALARPMYRITCPSRTSLHARSQVRAGHHGLMYRIIGHYPVVSPMVTHVTVSGLWRGIFSVGWHSRARTRP